MDAQTLANLVGQKLRDAEHNAKSENANATSASLSTLHNLLGQVFVYVTTELGVDLDWDAIAGNATKIGGAHTNGGGSKDPPPPGP